MEERNREILLVCLEVICLTVFLPIFYWGSLKLLYIPLGEIFYHPSKEPVISRWIFALTILLLDIIWIILMKLCPKNKRHAKVILTLLVLTFSASVLSSFWVLDALEGAF